MNKPRTANDIHDELEDEIETLETFSHLLLVADVNKLPDDRAKHSKVFINTTVHKIYGLGEELAALAGKKP